VDVGRVSSGSFCPTLGAAASMAVVDRAAAAPGTALEVVIRDSVQPARVVPLPFYTRPRG
jgi:aminomethyltransferase